MPLSPVFPLYYDQNEMSQAGCKTRADINDAPEQTQGWVDMNSLREHPQESALGLPGSWGSHRADV